MLFKLTWRGDSDSFSLLVGHICFNAIIASLQNFKPITSSSSRPYLTDTEIKKKQKTMMWDQCKIFYMRVYEKQLDYLLYYNIKYQIMIKNRRKFFLFLINQKIILRRQCLPLDFCLFYFFTVDIMFSFFEKIGRKKRTKQITSEYLFLRCLPEARI